MPVSGRDLSLIDEFKVVLTPPPEFHASRVHSSTAALKTFSTTLESGGSARHYASSDTAVQAGFLFKQQPAPAVPLTTTYEIGNIASWKHVEEGLFRFESSQPTFS
jgi:hypothetical protein